MAALFFMFLFSILIAANVVALLVNAIKGDYVAAFINALTAVMLLFSGMVNAMRFVRDEGK